ncbi:MAG: glycerol-3-phosphate 1-O-acyltransferase PlsY [Spirochaetes bacterium]|nr:glycerol-3-phosphate 1-O-acyltransferase PlsY [Spirochaetota bacterium]
MDIVKLLLGLLTAYLIGSFPTGVIVGKLLFHKDPRDSGSGASGATNIFRQFGPAAGVAVIFVDVAKGALAVAASAALGSGAAAAAATPAPSTVILLIRIAGALLAVLGHVYPIFAGFRGGKGVATGAGALLIIAPEAVLWSGAGFLLVIGLTGIVSASSITAALILPVSVGLGAAGVPPSPWLFGVSALLALFVVFTHRANIRRIIRKEEKSFPRLRFLRKKP